MRSVVWTATAKANLKSFIDWYRPAGDHIAAAMARDIYAQAAMLTKDIDTGRPSQYDGLREKSLPRWAKIIIYKRDVDLVAIIAILDTRMVRPERMADE